MMNKLVRLLFDAWFMRAQLILPLLSRKIPIIGQAVLVKSTFAAGGRKGFACRRDTASVYMPLRYRAFVSQPETLVGREQLVAAETHCAGVVDADSLDGVDTGSSY